MNPTNNPLVDALLSLFEISLKIGPMLPGVLFNVAGIWLASVGWKRHRVPGFLMLLIASVIGVAACLLQVSMMAQGVRRFYDSPQHAFAVANAVGMFAPFFAFAGHWHLVYRTRFAPQEDSDQSPP